MKDKFLGFNIIVFAVLIMLFIIGGGLDSNIHYVFAQNSWINPIVREYYHFTGIILQIFSALGVLIQLVFINKKLLSVH